MVRVRSVNWTGVARGVTETSEDDGKGNESAGCDAPGVEMAAGNEDEDCEQNPGFPSVPPRPRPFVSKVKRVED